MKQTIITILLALFAIVGQAQEFTPVVEDSIDFVINGTTISTEDSVMWWQCGPYPKEPIDYFVPIKDGQFRIEGRLPRHIFIQVAADEGSDLNLIVEETPTTVNLEMCEVSGSEQQKRFVLIQKEEREIERKMWTGLTSEEQERVMQMAEGEIPIATAQDSLHVHRYNESWKEIDSLRQKCYSENLDNFLPAYYLYVNHMNLPLKELEVFMREDAPYAHHPAMSHVWKLYWGLKTQNDIVVKPFIDFEAETPDGTKHHLSEYAGKGQYVLIDFWASWCGPCIGSFPMMKQLHEAYKDRGLHIVGVSCDKDREAWLKALDKHQLPWTALLSPSAKGDACSLYGVSGIPTVILIAPDGTILSISTETEELEPLIKKALNIE